MSLSQSTLYTSFLKRSAPETHDADDGTSNVVHSKKKKSEDNKKKYETKRIRKFQPAWQKEFDWVVYQEETNIFFGQVVLWFGQAKYTLYLSQGTSELKRKFPAMSSL